MELSTHVLSQTQQLAGTQSPKTSSSMFDVSQTRFIISNGGGFSSAQCVNHKLVHLMYWKFLKIYKYKHIIESERQIHLTFTFVQLLLSLTQRLVTFL